MRKRFTVLLVLLVAISSLAYRPAAARPSHAAETNLDLPGFGNPTGLQGPSYPAVPDRIIVKFRQGVQPVRSASGALCTGEATLDRLLTAPEVQTARPLLMTDLKDSAGPSGVGLERIYRLDLAPGTESTALIAALAADPAVEYAEPDYIAHAIAVPNDPLFPQQWGLTKIQAPAAWDVVTGTQTVIIAAVDSGLDLTHPDLVNRLWVNPGEIAANSLDDDNNGYVDDVRGWNFVHGSNNVADGNGHGTQVAGVAAAVANDGVGIAGVCWNCRLMPVKVMADSGVANYSDIALGVIYATNKGAHVINLSLGGYAYSNLLRDAVDYAVGKGAVVVGGAGNDNVATPFYPAAYENVLAVAATDDADHKVSFSNYGAWVDLSAPGATITTTFLGGDWGPADGTSLSTAFVSGLAALVRSRWPGWTPALVRNQLLQTADAIDALNPAYAGKLGAGRINAAAAMQEPHPVLTLSAMSVNGDPLGRPTPGAAATLAVTLRNAWADATGVTGVLSTADPYVTLTNDTASYGDIPAGASGVSSPDYSFTVASGAGYNHPIPFTLLVAANGGAYTTTIPLTVTTRSSDEHVCGTIAEDMTWTNDKTYILDCNVGIAPGYTLTIQAGTVVRFNGNYNLNVGGTLIADGTATQPIRFMSHAGGSWGRIFFDDPSVDAQATVSGTYQGGNLLRHVRIEGAAQGIGCANATPFLDHVTLTGGGMNCAIEFSPLWLQDSDMTGGAAVSAPVEVGFSYTPGGPARGVAVSGEYAYVADEDFGLHIIDVSDPAHPAEVGFYDTPGDDFDVAISGGYAYVADGLSGLRVIDVSDPAHPAEVGFYDTPGDAFDVAISGGYAYVADRGAGLRIIDVSDPAHPAEVGFYDTPNQAQGVAVSGGYAYVAVRQAGLRVIDISDPAHPAEVGYYYTPGYAWGVAVSSGYAYVADGLSGLRVIDVSDPAHPAEVGFYNTPGQAYSVAISGGYAYVADGEAGLRVIDVSDPAHPAEVGFYDTPDLALGVAVSGGYAYVADGLSGLRIYHSYEWFSAYVHRTAIRGGGLSLPNRSQVLASTIAGSITAGSGSIIQDTTAHGGITINGIGTVADSTAAGAIALGGGTVQHNTVTNGGINLGSGSVLSNTVQGGISLGSGSVLGNTVRDGGISAGSGSTVRGNDVHGGGISVGIGSTVRGNNVENAPGWAVSGNPSVVAENRLVGNASGIRVGGGVVEHNLIANTAGVGLEIAGSATAQHNTFTNIGGSAVKITAGAPAALTDNNFEFNTGAYDVEDLVPKTVLPTVDARGNWWGTTSAAAIRGRIWDFSDDYTLGTVLYSPVLTQPSALAPAYVRAVTLTPESPVGIQTVAFDVLFSREMDTKVAPQIAFIGPNQVRYTDFYNGSWLAPTVYRALYDFSTLIPRGTYTLTVSGARMPESSGSGTPIPAGGMEIAPNSATTFTVDYAGYINDVTAPPAPSVTACAAATPDTLSAYWSANDPESAIDRYQYAIGVAPGGAEVINWTFTTLTAITRTNLSLLPGQTYYVSVKARNEGGIWSEAGSAGVVAGSGGCASKNDAPYFASAPVLTATQGTPYTYAIAAEDPDLIHGDALTITAPTLPTWLTLVDHGDGTATLAGTPSNADVGQHPVVLRVVDRSGLSDTQSFTITVANVNDAPYFASAPVLTAMQDAPYTYAVATDDPDLIHGDSLTITAPTLPTWLTLVDHGDGTATLAGTPDDDDVGQHLVVLRVTDGEGTFAEQEFVITVSEKPRCYIYIPLVFRNWRP